MAKKSRGRRAAASAGAPIGREAGHEVGPRQPCPCGSGRRYKACHGAVDGTTPYVVRSFEGLPGECDWIALREFVPAASASLALRPGAYDGAGDDRSVVVATVLPGISPALVKADGTVWVAVQVAHQSGDPSRDLAEALRLGLEGGPGHSVVMASLSATGPRLQDVVDPGSAFEVTVLDGFEFWFDGTEESDATVAATLERLDDAVDPTRRLTTVEAAYWVSIGTKEHLRWVLPHDEEPLLSALARLHVAKADQLGPDSRLVGSFRAHGLLVPVWDLPVGTGAEVLERPAADFAVRLGEALADSRPLNDEERSARSGLANRQVTIR
ncbi:MAG: DUF5926 family protein [Nocardioidaceae bacterium]